MFLILLVLLGIFLIASVSAADLNDTDEVICLDDDVNEVISSVSSEDLNDADEVICLDDDVNEVISSVSPDDLNATEDVISLDKNIDEISVNEESQALSKTFTISHGNFWGDIQDANPGDTIIIDGAYGITVCVPIKKQLTFVGTNNAVLDGENNNGIFSIEADGVTFKNITFQNANSDNAGAIKLVGINNVTFDNCTFINCYSSDCGGAIRLFGSSDVTIDNSTFINCHSYQYGGAIDTSSSSDLKISNSNFTNCYCDNQRGGALSFDSPVNFYISNCYFDSCYSKNDDGGAIRLSTAKNAYIGDCTFLNCSSNAGGAVHVTNLRGDSKDIVIEKCYFDNNFANEYGGAIDIYRTSNVKILKCNFSNCNVNKLGGGILLTDVNNATMSNSIFINCSASGSGGAIGARTSSDLKISNSNFTKCYSSNQGGAIFVEESTNCNISDSYFNKNQAGSYGGSISIGNITDSPSVNSVIVSSSTFVKNSADNGGAVYFSSVGSVMNCSFVNNSAVDGASIIFVGGLNSVFNCSFVNNYAGSVGAALVISEGAKATIYNSSFINNTAKIFGGAIFTDLNTNVVLPSIYNSYFENNAAGTNGGACYIQYLNDCSIVNCTFVNNYAGSVGADSGASDIRFHMNSNINVNNCLFKGGNAVGNGGSIQANVVSNINIVDSNFTNCYSSKDGGAIQWDNGDNFNLVRCRFENCTSGNDKNSVTFTAGAYKVTDCTFDVDPKGVVYRYNSKLDVDDLSIVSGEVGYLQVKLYDIRGPLSDKSVTFTVNGVSENRTTNSKGLASFKVSDIFTNLGEYYVNVSFEKDGHNTAVSKNVKVSVVSYKGILNVTKEGEYYNDTNLLIKLTDLDKNPIPYSNIELKFSNGTTVNRATDSNGMYSYKILFAPGKYNVTARVTTNHVDVNEVEMNFEVKRLEGEIQLSLSNNNRTVTVKLVNPENGDVYRNVKVDLEFSTGDVYSVRTNSLGIATYNIPFEKGTYSLKAIVSGSYKDFSSSELIDFIISSEYDPNMGNMIYTKIRFGNSIVFDYLKSGSTTWAVVGGTILEENISVDYHPEADIKLVGNVITVSGLDVGSYTLRVVSTPEDNFYSDEATVGITVNKVSVMISAPKASVYYNSGNTWSIKLYGGKSKEALSNMKVTVKVYAGSKLYKSFTLTTDAKGIASLKVSTWNVGAHKVVVSFSKDGYTSKTVNSVVTILKTPVVITAPKLSVYLKTAKKWSIKVVDSKTKKAITATKLTLKVYTGKKYKSYFVKTNSKGIATFATSGLAVGTHKIVVSFSKTGYVSKSVSSSIVVKPIPLNIKADFSYSSSGSTVRVTVTNKLTGNPANGISVKLIVYTGSKITKSYTLVTGNYKTYKGFVGFGTNAFSVGTHKVVIKPVSNMYSGQGTTSLVIKSGAASGGIHYSFVSRGKLTLA